MGAVGGWAGGAWACCCLLLPLIHAAPEGGGAGKPDRDMTLHFLRNASVTCNDGSPAGYYIRQSKDSKRWLLYLEGGWYCISKYTCKSRFRTFRTLMGSSSWAQTRRGKGILSVKPEENPYWWNSNMVLLPYCSSDVWSGTRPKKDDDDFAFLGALIIKEVVKELLPRGLAEAQVLILTGSSAGGIGVLVNVDHVAEQIQALGLPSVQVRGLTDSGWIVDRKRYRFGDCLDVLNCGPIDSVKKGIRQWWTVMPEVCRRAHLGEEWKCFFGNNIYPTLKSPLFVMEWLFDEAQLVIYNATVMGQPVLRGEWSYLRSLGRDIRSTLLRVSAAFAPSCVAHELINSNSWVDVQVRGTSLPAALHCWDLSFLGGGRGPAPPAVAGCPQLAIDGCLWPQCNPTCPTIFQQQGQFLEYLEDGVVKLATQGGPGARDAKWLLG